MLLTLTASHRIAMGSIILFFTLGFIVLLFVGEAEGIRAAEAYVPPEDGTRPAEEVL